MVKLQVTYLKPPAKAGEAPQQVTVAVKNLLDFEPMRQFMADFVKNFVSFPPLGLILTMMLGIALLDQTAPKKTFRTTWPKASKVLPGLL